MDGINTIPLRSLKKAVAGFEAVPPRANSSGAALSAVKLPRLQSHGTWAKLAHCGQDRVKSWSLESTRLNANFFSLSSEFGAGWLLFRQGTSVRASCCNSAKHADQVSVDRNRKWSVLTHVSGGDSVPTSSTHSMPCLERTDWLQSRWATPHQKGVGLRCHGSGNRSTVNKPRV